MPRVRRFISATLLLALFVFAALPALAQEEEETTDTTVAEDGATETTGAEEETEEAVSGPVAPPAVSVPESAPADETADWTYRFLIPTLLALAALVVVMTTIQYFLRVVRSRYKVVE